MRTRKKELISDELKPIVSKTIKEAREKQCNQMKISKITKKIKRA